MNALILFFQNYKKIIIGIVAAVLAIVFLGMASAILYYKGKVTSVELKYQKEKVAQQEEQLKLYDNMISEIKAHNARMQTIDKTTGKIAEQIKNLKGVNDEAFFNTYIDIVHRFNNRVQ